MYIRTVNGNIINVDAIVETLNKRPIKFRETRETVLSYYKHKSQGDNLIDVLEDYDTLIEMEDNKIVSHMSYKSFKYFYAYGIERGLEEKMLSKYQVITHEQYMKLSQEVK